MLKKGMYYICSPLSASTKEEIQKNMLQARHYMESISQSFSCRAIAPHAYLPELLDDQSQRERSLGLAIGQVLLSWCDGLIVCGDVISSGMKKELEAAEKKQIPIYFYRENRRGFYISTYRKQERKNEMQI